MAKINYAKLPTEQTNPRTRNIDRLSTRQVLDLINREDMTVPRAVGRAKKQIAAAVEIMVRTLKSGGRILFAGAGTSGRLGVLEAAECPPTFNTPPSLIQAYMAGGKNSVFRSREGAEDRGEEAKQLFSKKVRKQDVLIGIAASGVTPYVAGAIESAKRKGAATILLTCHPKAPARKQIDCLIAISVGPEVITGSTRLKAGTATKLVLNMLTVATMVRMGKVYQNWMVDLQPKSKKLEHRALRIIQRLGGVRTEEAAAYLRRSNRSVKLAILMAAAGLSYNQAKTKLKETGGFLEKALRKTHKA